MYKIARWSGLFVLSLLATLSHAETYYRWVDENNVTHYTRQAPDGRQTEQVNTLTGRNTSPPKSTTATNNSEETTEQPAPQSADAPQAKKNKDICQKAKANLQTLTEHAVIRQRNKHDEVEVLSDEQKQREIDRAKKAIKDNC